MAAVTQERGELQGLAAELSRLRPLTEDYISDTRRMSFEVVGPVAEETPAEVRLILDSPPDDDQGFIETRVNDHAQQQIGGRLGIPRKYWDRMRDDHPDILQETVSKLFVREPEERMVRTIEGTARAFLSTKYRVLDNYDLLEHSVVPALQKAGNDQMHVLQARTTELRMYLKVLFPDVQFDDPRPQGGIMHGGVVIGNSEVGAGTLFVEPFMYASYCTNGMVFGKQDFADFGLRKTHIGKRIENNDEARRMFSDATLKKEDEAFYSMAYDLILNSANGVRFAAIIDTIEAAAGIKVEGDSVAAVERVVKKYDMRDDEHKAMMNHLIEGGDLSAWGYANAVTRTARDVAVYDRQVELERVGGDMLQLSQREWKDLARAA